MSTLNPDQLPTSTAQFIAYGTPTRVADPFGGEDALSVRPQVYVRYYRGIKVQELVEGGRSGGDTIHVKFDPESVGLKQAFGCFINPEDPLVAYIREKYEADLPMDIGIELVRKQKAKDSKEKIQPFTPIHALRGAKAKDGSGDSATMMGVSGQHIRNIVGMVDGRRSTIIESDPREWRTLTGNREGELPPEDWRVLADREDWTRVGAIVPKGESIPDTSGASQSGQQGPGIDMNVFSKVVRHALHEVLKDYGDDLRRQDAASQGTPTSSNSHSTGNIEGKPWVTRINKDHLNLGSYLVASESYALRWAHRYLEDIEDKETHQSASQELAQQSQEIADKVQASAYKGEIRADRTSPSHKQATMWVRFHIENTYPFTLDEDFDQEEWFNNVGRTATESLNKAERHAEEYLAERHPSTQKPQQDEKGTDESTTPETTGDADSDAGTDTGSTENGNNGNHVLDAYLQMLGSNWTDMNGIYALASEAKEKSLINETIWANPRDGVFSADQFEGAEQYTIADLTRRQYGLLKDAAPQDSNAGNEPTHDEPAPADEAPEPESQTPVDAHNIAAHLSRATTEEQVKALYSKAREANLLTTEVQAKEGTGTFGYAPVPPNTTDAETVALGAVFNKIRENIEASEEKATEGQDKTDAPAEDTPDPASTEDKAPAEGTPKDDAPAPAEEPPADADDQDAKAQGIAESAAKETDPAKIEKLIKQAQDGGLMDCQVEASGAAGPLGGLLASRQKRANRSK